MPDTKNILLCQISCHALCKEAFVNVDLAIILNIRGRHASDCVYLEVYFFQPLYTNIFHSIKLLDLSNLTPIL